MRLISDRDIPIAAALGALFVFGCQFDTSAPLHNNEPRWIDIETVDKTIRYPDSALCTLQVRDLNDTTLDFITCFGDDTSAPAFHTWPWTSRESGDLPGIRSFYLTVDPCSLGFFSGYFRAEDAYGARADLPFRFVTLFDDPLDRLPLSRNWTAEPMRDSGYIGFDFLTNRVRFTFPESGDSAPSSTGLRTTFAMSGDVETSVRFQLRDDMREGFEVTFAISTSPLAGLWDGEKTGFRISGMPGHVRFTCFSVNMQTDSRDVSRNFSEFAGYLTLSRTADSVRYRFIPGDPQLPELPMNRFSFPADTAVYVHLRMSVTDRLRTRHCLWSDFGVTRGRVRICQ